MNKKHITQYDVERQNKKLHTLEHRIQYYINQHISLKEKFNKIIKEYKESCDVLKIKENDKNIVLKYKKDYENIKLLEQQKKDLQLELEKIKSEQKSIKQSYLDYEMEKNKLQKKYDELLQEYQELKNQSDQIDSQIDEEEINQKNLKECLQEKIREESALRLYYEKEMKKMQKKVQNFVPPVEQYDINIAGTNNLDFHNMSDVINNGEDDLDVDLEAMDDAKALEGNNFK